MPDPRHLRPGKLPADLLSHLLSRLGADDPRVLVGPGVGEDAAIIRLGDRLLVAKTDPITFATDRIGWYAVQVNANDIAASGGEPRWLLATVLLPEGATAEQAEGIFSQLREASEAIGVSLVGGHTEITIGLSRPIVCGTMLGEIEDGPPITTSGARPSDLIMLTKGIAIEGTSILAHEAAARLAAAGVPSETLSRARQLLFDPGISVLPESRAARAAGGVTSMHDVTEGGLAGALAELSAACGSGVEIDRSAVRALPETAEVCAALDIDPWGLLASGAMLITAGESAVPAIVAAVRQVGVDVREIGRLTAPGAPNTLLADGASMPFPVFERDELARVLEGL